MAANDLARQWEDIAADALAAVDRVGRSGWLILGEEVAAFESRARRVVGRAARGRRGQRPRCVGDRAALRGHRARRPGADDAADGVRHDAGDPARRRDAGVVRRRRQRRHGPRGGGRGAGVGPRDPRGAAGPSLRPSAVAVGAGGARRRARRRRHRGLRPERGRAARGPPDGGGRPGRRHEPVPDEEPRRDGRRGRRADRRRRASPSAPARCATTARTAATITSSRGSTAGWTSCTPRSCAPRTCRGSTAGCTAARRSRSATSPGLEGTAFRPLRPDRRALGEPPLRGRGDRRRARRAGARLRRRRRGRRPPLPRRLPRPAGVRRRGRRGARRAAGGPPPGGARAVAADPPVPHR